MVYIVANDAEDSASGSQWFAGNVLLNGSFEIAAANAGTDKLSTETWVHIYSDETKTTLLMTVRFHTSCSQPINLNDRYGAIQLTAYVGSN